MKKVSFFALVGALVTVSTMALPQAASAAEAQQGKMLYTSAGGRLVPVYRVTADGSAQIIFEGKIVTIPASTLTLTEGRLVTSMKKEQIF